MPTMGQPTCSLWSGLRIFIDGAFTFKKYHKHLNFVKDLSEFAIAKLSLFLDYGLGGGLVFLNFK
jgi:hypothetical protein